jgi:hypothetical protein
MIILSYEFLESAEGSYNGLLGELVRTIRLYYTSAPDMLNALKPAIHALSRSLYEIDDSLGREERDYISEIMDALTAEQEVYPAFMEELPILCDTVCRTLFDTPFVMDDFSFEYSNERAEHIVQFFGYKDKREAADELRAISEAMRALCYRRGIIFIDSSPRT